MKYYKKKEKNYHHWEEVGERDGYMTAEGNNEYAQIRNILGNYIQDEDKILDVGCANGNNLEWWEKMGKKFEYVGMDYSNNFIKTNTKRRPDIRWKVADARKLPVKDGEFDVVVIYDVLDALEGWQEALSEAIRASRKRILITMWMDAHMEEKKVYLEKKGLKVVKIEIVGDGIHYHYILICDKT